MKSVDWNIIAKYLANETLTKEERNYIDQVKNDDELKTILAASAHDLKKADQLFSLKHFDTEKALNLINQQIDNKKTKALTLSWRFLRVAAIIIMVLATTFTTYKLVKPKKDLVFQTALNDTSCPEINLPDGTRVTLNHGSKLHYPKQFKANNRTVLLEGEAFFDVTPNKQVPFIIKTYSASVKVLGTSFNVKSYRNSRVEVIVRTGKVELVEDMPGTDENKKVLLLPGDKGSFDTNTGLLLKETHFDANQLAWFTHQIVFNFTNLSEVVLTLKQVYNTDIELAGDVDLNQTINATFNKQEPGYILDVVALTLDLDISYTGKNAFYIKNK